MQYISVILDKRLRVLDDCVICVRSNAGRIQKMGCKHIRRLIRVSSMAPHRGTREAQGCVHSVVVQRKKKHRV